MRIVLINTSDINGGAAIAARRLLHALINEKIDARLLVQEKRSADNQVYSTTHSSIKRIFNFYRFAFERFLFFLREKDKSVRFSFSIANTGEDISKNPLVKEADIIHLHWINGGFLSLTSLKKLLKLNKPIVWTFHDMWAFTGGCHYAGSCENFKTQCFNCPYLKNPHKKDLSFRIWSRKQKIFENKDIHIVTCSNWLQRVTLQSMLLKENKIISIQNPIDTNIFKPINKTDSRKNLGIVTDKKLILFGAMNVNDKRKGSVYLLDALNYISKNNPELKDKIALVVFGKNKTPLETDFEMINLKFINNEADIVNIYNACDVFVTPSIEDNLPNTIVESHACGVPVVAFNTTGMTEMISHQVNGYLASNKSPEDLANGIIWILFNSDYKSLCEQARKKAVDYYSPELSAEKYINLYKSLLNTSE
ncbi:MAG: glycosyltransferase family 4 protein [Bacteroidales bacterium]